jgi:hypothetical protein
VRISVAEIETTCEQLLRHLRAEGITEVEIEKDYYWSIPERALYDPTAQPKELTIGQLTDDWRELQRIRDGEKQPIGYALVWLAALLRAVGQQIPF